MLMPLRHVLLSLKSVIEEISLLFIILLIAIVDMQ